MTNQRRLEWEDFVTEFTLMEQSSLFLCHNLLCDEQHLVDGCTFSTFQANEIRTLLILLFDFSWRFSFGDDLMPV